MQKVGLKYRESNSRVKVVSNRVPSGAIVLTNMVVSRVVNRINRDQRTRLPFKASLTGQVRRVVFMVEAPNSGTAYKCEAKMVGIQ